MDYVGDASLAKTLALRVGIFAFFGLASAYVSQKCQFVDRKLSRFREMSEIIFRNVRAGLVLLAREVRQLQQVARLALPPFGDVALGIVDCVQLDRAFEHRNAHGRPILCQGREIAVVGVD